MSQMDSLVGITLNMLMLIPTKKTFPDKKTFLDILYNG